MKQHHEFCRPLGTALLVAIGLLASVAGAEDSGDPIEHQFILQLTADESIDEVASSYGAVVISRYDAQRLYLLATDPLTLDDDQQAEFELDDRIEASERNSFNAVAGGHTQSFFVQTAPSNYEPQATAALMQLPLVHKFSSGSGMVIAILDTGVAPHSEFSGRLRTDGFNFIDGTSDTSDVGNGALAGHGTFVAGAAHLIAPAADILPVKILDSTGFGTSFTIAAGIYYAIEHDARIINISLSSPEDSGAVAEAVAFAASRGVLVVAAVGNSGIDDLCFPAANVGAIAVAATDDHDLKAEFSDYGIMVDLCAPGVEIVSTMPGDTYAAASGTSFAAAFVSGSAAVVWSHAPNLPVSVIQIALAKTARNIDALNANLEGDLGAGRIRPWQALATVRKPPLRNATR